MAENRAGKGYRPSSLSSDPVYFEARERTRRLGHQTSPAPQFLDEEAQGTHCRNTAECGVYGDARGSTS